MIDLGSWQGLISSLVVALVLGVAVGATCKHFLKIGILLIFVIVVLVALGYVAPAQLILLIDLLKPEVTAVQGDLGLFIPLTASLFAVGVGLGLWKG